jgi:flagellar biosynthesis protein FlhG
MRAEPGGANHAAGFQRGAAGARRREARRPRAERSTPPVESFDVLAKQGGIVIVDGELNRDGRLCRAAAWPSSEIVIQVSTSADLDHECAWLIKRLAQEFGRRPFGILVTGASEAEAKWFTIIWRRQQAVTWQ